MRINDVILDETIRKVKGGYRLYSKDGSKNLGTYPTRAGAVKRERQVQYFKHAGESVDYSFKWQDFDGVCLDQRMKIVEAYFTNNTNLFETNNPENTKFFLSLTSMSSPLNKNEQYIISVLGLVNDKIVQLQIPEMCTLLDWSNNIFQVILENGKTTEFPNKYISEKMTASAFLFDSNQSYDKFRNIIKLKYDFNLIDIEEK